MKRKNRNFIEVVYTERAISPFPQSNRGISSYPQAKIMGIERKHGEEKRRGKQGLLNKKESKEEINMRILESIRKTEFVDRIIRASGDTKDTKSLSPMNKGSYYQYESNKISDASLGEEESPIFLEPMPPEVMINFDFTRVLDTKNNSQLGVKSMINFQNITHYRNNRIYHGERGLLTDRPDRGEDLNSISRLREDEKMLIKSYRRAKKSKIYIYIYILFRV